MGIFPQMMNSIFMMAKTGFDISIGQTGVLTLWLGIMKVGEPDGVVTVIPRLLNAFFNKLFPSLGKDHLAYVYFGH